MFQYDWKQEIADDSIAGLQSKGPFQNFNAKVDQIWTTDGQDRWTSSIHKPKVSCQGCIVYIAMLYVKVSLFQ